MELSEGHMQIEETFRGYLLVCFMATTAIKMMSDVLAKSRTSLIVELMLEILHEQHAIECDGQLVTTESVRKMNEAYRAFGIKCPIPSTCQLWAKEVPGTQD